MWKISALLAVVAFGLGGIVAATVLTPDRLTGAHLATEIGFAAADVRAAVIKESGHWIMEEQPEQAVSIILSFLDTERSQG